MGRAAEPRAKCLRPLDGPAPRTHGTWHSCSASLLHLCQTIEPRSRVLLAELLDLERVLLQEALGSWLSTVVGDDAGALARQHRLGRLVGQARREDEDLALLLHVLSLQTATAASALRRHGAARCTRTGGHGRSRRRPVHACHASRQHLWAAQSGTHGATCSSADSHVAAGHVPRTCEWVTRHATGMRRVLLVRAQVRRHPSRATVGCMHAPNGASAHGEGATSMVVRVRW